MQDIVYKVPGKHHGPAGKTYNYIAVNSEDELKTKLKEGWFNTLDEAVNGKTAKPARAREEDGQYKGDDPSTPDVNEAYVSGAPPTRTELEVKAKELGITFRSNIGDKKLLEKIEAKLAEG